MTFPFWSWAAKQGNPSTSARSPWPVPDVLELGSEALDDPSVLELGGEALSLLQTGPG